jgi:histidine triad (HIT) family protein
MATDTDCIFCRIVAGELPAEVVRETDNVLVFSDLNPGAPTHLLLIPKDHHENAAALARNSPESAAEILVVAGEVAAELGLSGPNGPEEGDQGYRLVANTGAGVGQTVFHVHFHLLGGRSLGWPPG